MKINYLSLKMLRAVLVIVILFTALAASGQTTYYSKASATDFNTLASWGTNADGTGASPASITNVDNYIIQNGASMTLSANAAVKNLTIGGTGTGTLTLSTSTLTVSAATGNASALTVATNGTLTVNSGIITLNGGFVVNGSGTFNQSGGTITVDGNNNAVTASSYSTTSTLFIVTFNSSNINLTGGTLTIVDPSAQAAGGAFLYNNSSAHVNAGAAHTIKFGNGSSTQAGGNTSAFNMDTYYGSNRFAFGNLTVDAMTGTNRIVQQVWSMGIAGDLTITSGEYSMNTNGLYVAGNITNNGTFTTNSVLYFSTFASGVAGASTNAQTVSGTGTFRNLATGSTANFNSITVNNTNATGVTFSNANSLVCTTGVTNTGTVSGTLTLTAGKINIGAANTFILGTGTGALGTLTYTAGGFTNGTFSRWYSTTFTASTITASTDPSAVTSRYPFIAAGSAPTAVSDRSFYIAKSSGTITAGGTVGIKYVDATTFTVPGTSIVDATPAYTVNLRHDANWSVVTGGGFNTGTGVYTIATVAPGLFATTNAAAPRLVPANGPGVVGTYQGGTTTPGAQRITLSMAQLTAQSWYMGLNQADFTYQTVQTGNWSSTSTWAAGLVPASTNNAIINSGHNVTVDISNAFCNSLTINSTGTLTLSNAANALTITASTATTGITNNGTIALSNGTLTMGAAGGGIGLFTNASGGSLNVSGGTFNINGQSIIASGSSFSQSGGQIDVDPNSGTAGTSVASGTNVFSIGTSGTNYATGTISLTGGTFRLRDIPNAGTGISFAYYGSSTQNFTATTAHTFRIGDGTAGSTTTSTSGFVVNGMNVSGGGRLVLGTVIVDGFNTTRFATPGTNSLFRLYATDLTINVGAELRTTAFGGEARITRNLANNGTLTTFENSTFTLGGVSGNADAASTTAQSITTSSGVFRNNTTGSTGNFGALSINNSNATGVTFNIGSFSVTGTWTQTAGLVNIGSANTLTMGTTTATGTVTWTAGGITDGSIARNIPTATVISTAAQGLFPFTNGTDIRNATVGLTAGATTAGTITIKHNNVAGSTGVSFTDASGTPSVGIADRSNSNWSVFATTLAYTGTVGTLTLRADNSITVTAFGNVRAVGASASAAGVSIAGTGSNTNPLANKTTMAIADWGTSGTPAVLYIGQPRYIVSNVATGNWSSASSWLPAVTPTVGDIVTILTGHNITLDASTNVANGLTINSGGTLTASGGSNILTLGASLTNAGTLTASGATISVATDIANTGTINLSAGAINATSASTAALALNAGAALNISGGAFNYGPAAGGSRAFTLSGGTLAITGGTLAVGGNAALTSGVFNMSAGAFNIDGNSNGTAPASVAAATRIFAIDAAVTGTVNGGTITIVDPHFDAASTQTFAFTGSTSDRSWIGNTLRFGGTSTDASASTSGFHFDCFVNSSRLTLGDVVVNGGAGTNRFTSSATSTSDGAYLTNLTINSGSEFRTAGNGIWIAGNINNSGIFTNATGTVYFAGAGTTTAPPATTVAQTIQGSGVFRNNTANASSTANFTNLYINNTFNGTNVTFNSQNTLICTTGGPTNTATVSGTFTLVAGAVSLNSNTFTLGTAAASPGTMTLTAGAGFTGGTLTRWVNTSTIAVPSAGSFTATGVFPFLSASGQNRYFHYAHTGAITTGGSVSVKYNDVAGTSSITSYTDLGVAISIRSNSNWQVSTSGLVYPSSLGAVRASGTGYTVSNVADARLSFVSGAATGVSSAGTNTVANPEGNKGSMAVTDFTGTFYFATPSVVVSTVTGGPWENGSTWVGGSAPICGSYVQIVSGATVTVSSSTTGNASAVTINSGGTLNMTGGSLSVGCSTNNAAFNNNGSFSISGGALNVNGNIAIANASNFSQSGGTITIDGNNGSGTVGNTSSVASGTPLFGIGTSSTAYSTGTLSVTGGTIIITDPHIGSLTNTSAYAFYANISGAGNSVNATNHTVQFGNGTSTDVGASTAGFVFDGYVGSGRFNFANLTVNSAIATTRVVTQTTNTQAINGNLTVTSGSYLQNALITNIGGNISVANAGTLVSNGTFVFCSTTGTTSAAQTTAQSVSVAGSGAINNLAASPTANFTNITINNTSSTGVTINALNNITSAPTNISSVSGSITFTAGLLTTGGSGLVWGTPAGGNVGTLTVTSGGVAPGSTFGRYWTAAQTGSTITSGADPATTTTRFPFVDGSGNNRSAWLARVTPTGAGVTAVTYVDSTGVTTGGLTIADGAYTVSRRSNFSWRVSTLGTTPNATSYTMATVAPGAYTPSTGNSRLVNFSSIIPSSTNATGTTTPGAQRTTITLANLTAKPIYIGIDDNDIPFISVATGAWDAGATWNKNPLVPNAGSTVTLASPYTVTVNAAAANANTLTINSGATLAVTGNTLTLSSTLTNNGTATINGGTANVGTTISNSGTINVTSGTLNAIATTAAYTPVSGAALNINGGTFNYGPAGGYNLVYQNVTGSTLNVSSGTFNINGRLFHNAGTFTQTGGNINVDANSGTAGTSFTTAVNGIVHFSGGTISASGGTITVVDPPHNSVGSGSSLGVYALYIGVTGTNTTAFSGTHTFVMGDGVSTTPGNTTDGFGIETYASGAWCIQNLIINGGGTAGRHTTPSYNTANNYGVFIKGNVTINSGSELRTVYSGPQFGVSGNLTNNGTLTYSNATALVLGNLATPSFTAPALQTISGNGVFRNATTSPTASFSNLTLNNTNGFAITATNNSTNNFSVSGTLTMTAGKIDLGASNTFTLGISAAAPGTLAWTTPSGFTSGTFGRYFAATTAIAIGTTMNTQGFPFYSAANTDRSTYFGITASGSGGLIKVKYTDATGTSLLTTPISDGTTLDSRSNAKWNVDGSGFSFASATGSLRFQATGIYGTIQNFANVRMVPVDGPNPAPGTSGAGTGTNAAPLGNKTGLVAADLPAGGTDYYFSSPSSIVSNVAAGNWNDPNSWLPIGVPTSTDNVTILNTHNITLDAPGGSSASLTINSGGTLTANANTLTVIGNITNAGTIALGGATITNGATGGGKAAFTISNGGTLNVTTGNLNINGRFVHSAGATFTQSGGAIAVDGNAGGVLANSVASGSQIVSLTRTSALPGAITLSGGTFTIVDPHADPAGTSTMLFSSDVTTQHINAGVGHTFIFGDPTSTDAGGNTFGMRINPNNTGNSMLAFGKVIINGTLANNREVTIFNTKFAVLSDLTVDNGGYFDGSYSNTTGANIYVGGNITVNTGSTFITPPAATALVLGNFSSNSLTASTNNQIITVNGTGSIANATASPTANFNSLTINNTNATGVSVASLNTVGTGTVSGTLTLTSGIVDLNTSTFTLGTSIAAPGTLSWNAGGFIDGTLTRWFGTGAITMPTSATGQFPFVSATGTDNRSAWIATSGAITGGTVSINYADASGTSVMTPVNDGVYTAKLRSNASWTVSNSINFGSSTGLLRIQGGGIATNDPTQTILTDNGLVANGTTVAGTGTSPNSQGNKTAFTGATLTGTYYVATPRNIVSNVVSGNWSTPASWLPVGVPSAGDLVTILNTHTITTDGANTATNLTINSGGALSVPVSTSLTLNSALTNSGTVTVNGTLATSTDITNNASSTINANAGTITVPGTFTNNGTLNVAGGNIDYGPSGGGNKTFTFGSASTLNLSAGRFTINGNFLKTQGTFTQTGGDLRIDGNSGTLATSVQQPTPHFSITTGGSTACSAGTITIVDPPHQSISAGTTLAFNLSITGGSTTMFTGTHTLVLGDGVSTTPGVADGFCIDDYTGGLVTLNNLTVNAGSATGRWASTSFQGSSYGVHVAKDLTINSGSEFRHTNTTQFFVAGNISNAGTLTVSSTSGLTFGNVSTIVAGAQTISGSGTYRNATSAPTASFSNLTFNNTNATGITINASNLSVSGTLTFTAGKVALGATNSFTLGTSATNAGTLSWTAGGFTNGTFTRWYTTAAVTLPAIAGRYPFVSGSNDRTAYFGTSGATSGGTVSVKYNDGSGVSSVTSFTDFGAGISAVSNANWVASNSFTFGASTGSLRLQGDGIFTGLANFADVRITAATGSAPGTSALGTGSNTNPQGNKTTLSAANLNSQTFYLGVPRVINSIATGNWSNVTPGSETWDCQCVPSSGDIVIINNLHNVSLDATTNAAGSLTVNSGGTLTGTASNTLTTTSTLSNSGTVSVSAGTITVGTSLTNAASSTINVGGGTLNVGTTIANSGTMNLSNGTINATATTAAYTIVSGTVLNISGGTFNYGPSGGYNRVMSFITGSSLIVSGGNLNINGSLNFAGSSVFNQSGGTISVDGNAGGVLANSITATPIIEFKSSALSLTGGTLICVDPSANTTATLSVSYNKTPNVTATGTHTLQIGNGVSTDPGGNATNQFAVDLWTGTGRLNLQNYVINVPAGTNRTVTQPHNQGCNGNLTITAGELVISGIDFHVGGNIVNNGTLTTSGALNFATSTGTSLTSTSNLQTVSGSGVFRNATSSPTASFANVTFNNTNSSASAITIGVNNLSVSGTLTFTAGNVALGTNTFSIGSSTTVLGSLSWTAGGFTSGNLKRWYGTAAEAIFNDPTNGYPFISGTDYRWGYFGTTGATSGGSVTIGYTDGSGFTTLGTPFTDLGVGITKVSNAAWNVSNTMSFGSSAGELSLEAMGVFGSTVPNFTDVRITGATASAPGVSATGSGSTTDQYGNKTGMSATDLSGTFYVALPSVIGTFQTGPWSVASTWVGGVVPTANDVALINPGHAVTLDANGSASSVTVSATGSLTIPANTLTLGGSVNNSGTITLSGGTLTQGAAGGDNTDFSNNSGATYLVSSGTHNLNGSLSILTGSTFTQSGGNIIIDGNANNVLANSVSIQPIVYLGGATYSLTGGAMTIVDPHADPNNYETFRYNSTSNYNSGVGHTIQYGNGVSTTATTGTQGFIFDPYFGTGRLQIGNLTINTGTTTNRHVVTLDNYGIVGNLTLTSGEYRTSTSSLTTYVNGNVSVASTGTLTTTGTLQLGNFASGSATASTNAQTISGAGTFRNAVTGSTASFANLWFNNSNATGITISTNNLSVSGSLVFGSGTNKVALGTNTLTLGVSTTTPGTLSYTAGSFTSGTFNRWYGTATVSMGANAGYYPFTSGSDDRSAYFGTSGTIIGGSLAVKYNDATGTTNVVTPFVDGGVGIAKTSNANWVVSNTIDLGVTSTGLLRLRGTGITTVTDFTAVRITTNTGAAGGTSVAGTGSNAAPEGNKTTMSAANLSGTLRIGYPSYIIAVANGNWNTASTWDCNCVPSAGDNATIPSPYTVTVNAASVGAGLTINTGGGLAVSGGSLTLGGNIANSGTYNQSAGTVTLGTTGGGNSTFSSASGTGVSTTVSGGTLNVNGNVNILGNTFTQSGGTIIVDGNSGVASTSVGSAVDFCYIGATTINCSAGTLRIVDPPHSSIVTTTRSLVINSASSSTAFSGTHTVEFGNGSSTTIGNNDGFIIETYNSGRVPLNNVTVNAGSATGRWVNGSLSSGSFGTHILGTLTINSGSEMRTNTIASEFILSGNIVNNGTFTVEKAITLGSSASYTISTPQTISGTGVFRNLSASPTANYTGLTINNAGGVTFSSSQSTSGVGTGTVSGTLAMTLGNIALGSNTFTLGTSAASTGTLSYTAGYFTSGTLSRWIGTSAITIGNVAGRFPFGTTGGVDRSYYAGTSAAITTGGKVNVTYTDAIATTAVSIVDAGSTVTARSNASWAVTQSGLVLGSATYLSRIQGNGIGTVTDFAASRQVFASAIAGGSSSAGTGSNTSPAANKSITSTTDIAGTFYFGIGSITCAQPTAQTATGITTSSANLGWTAGGTETAWDIEWMLASATPTGTPNVTGTTTNPYTLGSLSAGTAYKYYVRAACGGSFGNSAWVGPFTFSTLFGSAPNDVICNAISLTVNTQASFATYSNTGASTDATPSVASSCQSSINSDVWFKAVVPTEGTMSIYFRPGSAGTPLTDMVLHVYSSSNNLCSGTLTEVGCSDDNGPGNLPFAHLTGLTPSATLFIRASDYNTVDIGSFDIAVTPYWEWAGTTSTAWTTPGNWLSGDATIYPGYTGYTTANVLIPNVANDPVKTTAISIGSMNILSGALFTNSTSTLDLSGSLTTGSGVAITNNGGAVTVNGTTTIGSSNTITLNSNLALKGNLVSNSSTFNGTNLVIFNGSAAQSISGNNNTFSSVRINNTAGVTVASGANMQTITGVLEMRGGTLTANGNITLQSTATTQAYIDDFSSGNTGVVAGNVKVERYITSGPNGFRYIGAPVNTGSGVMALSAISGFVISGIPGQAIPQVGCSSANLAIGSPYGTFMYWQENSNYGTPPCRQAGWWFQTTGNMTLGRGYGAKLSGGSKVTYTGVPNTGTITNTTCTHTNVFSTALNGWNLVANPFPSSIGISSVSGDGSTANDMPAGFDGQIQFYQTSGPYTGTYLTYNVGLTAAPIALGQGFWVRVSNVGATPAFTLGAGHRTTTNATYYDVNPTIEQHLGVNVSGNGFMDKTDVYFLPEAQTTFDFYDASKWDSRAEQPTLYTSVGSEHASINSLPSLEETIVVPMGIKPGTNGNFTFTFDDIATFPQTSMIYLEDLKLGTMTDLRANNSYQFASTINDDANRFMLHFQPGLQAEVADQDCDNAGSIELTQPAPTVWSTYEVKGNDNNVYGTGTNLTGTVTINNLPAQEYVITVTHPSGYSAQEYITVNGSSPVSATITASATNVQVDQAVNLTATTSNATEYVWNFGDGSTQTGLTVVSHSYDAAGTYNVTLTASSDVCSDVAVKTIVVNNTTTGIDNTGTNSLNVYGSGSHIVVEFNNWSSDKANLTVYDMLGQQLNSVTGVSTIKGRQEIRMTDVKPGYYLLRVVSGDKTFTRKVFLTADE